MWESVVGQEGIEGVEGHSEAASTYPGQECETPSIHYSQVLAVHCEYPVTGLREEMPKGRQLAL